MYQLKAIQSSVDTNRRRNSSFKQEKSYFDQAQRRKSVLLDQMENNSQNQILKNYKSFLPQLKQENSDSLNTYFSAILSHYKMYNNQISKSNTWNQFFAQIWDNIHKNGDIYDVYMELFKKSDYAQKQALQKKLVELCYYEKLMISLGFEMQEDLQFNLFFSTFIQNYQSSLQELFMKGKLSKKQQQDALQILQFNNITEYKDEFEEILEKFQQGNTTIWMIRRKCKPTQQYKLNYKIVRRHFALWLHETRNQEIIRSLPKQLLTASSPFINSKINQPILIIDLDETLVHFDSATNKLFIRNGALQFLTQMHKYYYIIIWTAALPRYAKWALKKIDPQIHQLIDLLLTREYCIPHEKGYYQKILHMLGQELSTLLIVENDIKSIIESEKENLYLIESYLGQEDDLLILLSERLVEANKFYDEGFSFQRAVKMTFMK